MVTAVAQAPGEERDPGHDADDWVARRWLLALLGGLTGLAIYHITDRGGAADWTDDANRVSLATFLAVANVAFAFVVERGRIAGSAAFAIVAALVVASVLYWSGDFTSWEPWRFVSALLTVAIAAPLFQGWRDGGEVRWRIPYVAAHDRAWTNVCLWFASCGFVGVTFVLAFLLSQLFSLIGIDWLKDLLTKGWFVTTLAGAAFGGAVGLLRDRERIVRLIQRVVMMVLAVLAPVLAAGLVLFLLALPFTGLDALWETTRSTTPILLSCVVGALILANAVIGDRAEDESRLRVMRWSAMALGATMLPLGLIAAVSTGARIAQYGLSPSRLWAVTFTAIACAFGLAYLVAVLRGRRGGWSDDVRGANLRLAVGLCALAFLLSTPLVSFGAIAARDQVARLQRGITPPAKFDWAALRFDFGPAGVDALKRLAAEGRSPAIRTAAADALKSTDRWAVAERQREQEALANIVVAPRGVRLPAALRARLAQWDACGNDKPCNVYFRPGASEVLVVRRYQVTRLVPVGGKWVAPPRGDVSLTEADYDAVKRAFAGGAVEMRTVTRRQLFVGGKAVGEAFE